jgi:hypothetical protein
LVAAAGGDEEELGDAAGAAQVAVTGTSCIAALRKACLCMPNRFGGALPAALTPPISLPVPHTQPTTCSSYAIKKKDELERVARCVARSALRVWGRHCVRRSGLH